MIERLELHMLTESSRERAACNVFTDVQQGGCMRVWKNGTRDRQDSGSQWVQLLSNARCGPFIIVSRGPFYSY